MLPLGKKTTRPRPPSAAVKRGCRGPFVFEHDFTRENNGRLEDVYTMQKVALGEGSFGCLGERGLMPFL